MGDNLSEVVRLLAHDGTWDRFIADWEAQCTTYEESLSDYAVGTFSVIDDLVREEQKKAGAFGFFNEDKFVAVCQINVAGLPKYTSPVMRIRHLTLSPDLDFGEKPIEEYANALVFTLAGILHLSDTHEHMTVRHINVHLRSPADRPFFTTLGKGLDSSDEFASVQTRGSWLYITKS